jgi:hypothetical protein
MPSETIPAQITLAFSPTAGIVATPGGEQYQRAQTALDQSGFQPRPDGTYVLPHCDPETMRAACVDLARIAECRLTEVTVSPRRYLGDVADEIAAQLPGTWSASVEVYSHPAWQQDLLPWLWDAGELIHTVRHARIPYAAVLSEDAHAGAGVKLLLIERPGPQGGYLVGALTPHGFGADDREPLRSVVVPAAWGPQSAARAIIDRLLPAYHRALHTRRIAAVAAALGRIRAEHHSLHLLTEPNSPPMDPRELRGREEGFAAEAWYEFREVLTHGPALLEACHPEHSAWPEDAAALERLRGALEQGTMIQADWVAQVVALRQRGWPAETYLAAKAQRNAQARPVIATWLADGDTLIRQARAATPLGPRTAPSVPDHSAAAALPAPPEPPGTTPPRR